MNLTIRQITSMLKIRTLQDLPCADLSSRTVLAGERLNYQICLTGDVLMNADVSVESALADYVKLYRVRNVPMDTPVTYEMDKETEDYLSFEPGLMPDLLVPLSEERNRVYVNSEGSTLWVRIDIPKDLEAGVYPVNIHFQVSGLNMLSETQAFSTTLQAEVIPAVLPDQKLIYTRWFYADCIADYHQVEVYSEQHWDLIEKYIAMAADTGINMILVPIHTPPLDTAIGTRRTCVQLVDIEKKGATYSFQFEKFHRFIEICKKHGIRYFEMAHMFSQWGAKCAPNIMVTENGRKDYLFGWHVPAASDLYIHFLKQYLEALCAQLEIEGISQNTYFHISDEPKLETMETYQMASDLIRPMLKDSKTFDALSQIEFYEKGLVECPVTAVNHLAPFLEKDIPNQWAYYCVGQQHLMTNSFIADPSSRTRIAGFLMYRYNIKGFLHWGYNFYSSAVSLYPINPYVTTSSDGCFPSGDGFIVYPGQNTVYSSLRCEVFYEALQDMRICSRLEELIGRDAVIAMIDEAAGYTITFERYPRGYEYQETLRETMIEKIRMYCAK